MQFRGDYHFLSNMYQHPLVYNGVKYATAEAAFQSAKCPGHEQEFAALQDGFSARKLGRKLPMIANWDLIKVQIMEEILRIKFQKPEYSVTRPINLQDIYFRLLRTRGYIQEDNYWHDTFWGVCDGVGENHLGRILMRIRDERLKEASKYKIYTSYFANLKNLPENAVVVSIARSQPQGMNLPEFKAFAPSAELLHAYKQGKVTNEEYETQYLAQLEALPNLSKIKEHLAQYTKDQDKDLVFLCWEAPGKFCHRHVLAKFFAKFDITEF